VRRHIEAHEKNILAELEAAWREHGVPSPTILRTHSIICAAGGIETIISHDLYYLLVQPKCGLESGRLVREIMEYCKNNRNVEPSRLLRRANVGEIGDVASSELLH
jgi:hypothetical protein